MIYIFDWKTTANINRVNGGVGITNITNGIRDTTLNKYSLQLSAYNYLLNKSHNIKVHSQYVVHLTDKGYHIIDSEYREGIIKDIFNKQIKLKPKIRKKKNPRKQSLNKRKTKQPVNKRKLVKGPSDSLRNRCKKLGVPLTRQVNGKRVYKTTKMLQQHCRLKENKRLNKSAKRIKNEKNSDNIFGYTMLLLAIFFVIIAGSLLGWIN